MPLAPLWRAMNNRAMSGPPQVRPPRRPRALVPREHGAYGQLLVPLACALLLAIVSSPAANELAAAAMLAAAFIAAFFAHEPLLVLLGHRGTRALADDSPRARVLLRNLLVAAAALAAGGAWLAVAEARWAVAIPAALGAGTALAAAKRVIKTTAGELLAAAALSSTAVPVVLAAGGTWAAALALWLVFLAGFVDATLVVRALVGRLGGMASPRGSRVAAALVALSLAAVTALVLSGRVAPLLASAVAPVGLVSLGVALLAPAPRHLRTVGWLTAAATLVTGGLLVIAIR